MFNMSFILTENLLKIRCNKKTNISLAVYGNAKHKRQIINDRGFEIVFFTWDSLNLTISIISYQPILDPTDFITVEFRKIFFILIPRMGI